MTIESPPLRTRSGRPITADSVRMVAISATIQGAQRDWLRKLGSGSISQGLRKAIGLAGGPETTTEMTTALARKQAEADAWNEAMEPAKAVYAARQAARMAKLAAAGSAYAGTAVSTPTEAEVDPWTVDTSHE
jgi:hypothetical protein